MLERGLVAIDEHLKDVIPRGGRLRVLTGDYLDVTEPTALLDPAIPAGSYSYTLPRPAPLYEQVSLWLRQQYEAV